MQKGSFTLVLGLLLLLAASAGRANGVSAAMLQEDARLQTRVTLRSPRILMGELLERLSRQSGVTLIADDPSFAGSDCVTVSLRDVPLADAMDSLWSLFSYQHAEWQWRRTAGKDAGGKFVYTLARPDNARFLAERLKEQVQTDFEAQAKELMSAADMPPDQLKEAAKHDFLLYSMAVDGTVRPGMRILTNLPPGALTALLRGGPPISMPVSELPPQSRQALEEARAWQAAKFAADHVPEAMIKKSLPEPTQMWITVSRNQEQVAPGLYIDTGQGSGDYFGGGYMESPWRQKMNADWMQPGDAPDDPVAARDLTTPKQPSPIADGRHPLADYLLRFSDMAQVPLIARIPRDMDTGTSEATVSEFPQAKTVSAVLKQAGKGVTNLQHKWRGGILLLACQNWFMSESEDTRLPWAEVRRLRDAEATGNGWLSLNDLAHAAHALNAGQIHSLGEWFPVMDSVVTWQDFLAFYDKTPDYRARVLSPTGDAFEYPESMVNSQLGIDTLRMTNPNLRLRVTEKQNLERKPPAHEIAFLALDDAGKQVLVGQGFGYRPHEYQTSLKVEEGAPTQDKPNPTAR